MIVILMHKQLQNLIVNDFKYAIATKAEIAYQGLKLNRTFPEMLPTFFFFQYRSVVRHYHSGQKTTIEMHFMYPLWDPSPLPLNILVTVGDYFIAGSALSRWHLGLSLTRSARVDLHTNKSRVG